MLKVSWSSGRTTSTLQVIVTTNAVYLYLVKSENIENIN